MARILRPIIHNKQVLPQSSFIRPLLESDGAQYQILRLTALQTDPEAFLAEFETERQHHESHFEWVLTSSHQPPMFGYYGYFMPSAAPDPAVDHPTLIGYIQLGYSAMAKQQHVGFLYNLYVHPDHRGQGVAKRLLKHVEAQAATAPTRKLEILYLSCLASNQPAYRFYKKQGYRRCGIKPSSVKTATGYVDEIEMVKFLVQ